LALGNYVVLEKLGQGGMGLRYRAIDANTLQVTTRKAANARLELEFYPAADLLAGNRPARAVVGQIKSRLAASTWGEVGGPGVLHLDGPSGCLIVLQSQPVQAAIQVVAPSNVLPYTPLPRRVHRRAVPR
jgi:serine/threonine protein kinase